MYLKPGFFFFSAMGFLLSLWVHVHSLSMPDTANQHFNALWDMHIGLIVVWIPAIIELRKKKVLNISGPLPKLHFIRFFRHLFKTSPKWLGVLSILAFVYALFNFSLFIHSQLNATDIQNGFYAIRDHSELLQIIQEKNPGFISGEYYESSTGYIAAFYFIAGALHYPFDLLR
jgi:hypothetical protein